jgi:hypothetical protein
MLITNQLFIWVYYLSNDVWLPLLQRVLCNCPSKDKIVPLSLIVKETKLSMDGV